MRRIVVLICLAALAALPAGAGAAGIDGPGSYYMLRSFDTGQPFAAEQEQACLEHYGPVRNATALDLNAGVFAFTGDPQTGRVLDQRARYLGPAFGCLAPAASPDLLEMFVGSPAPLFGFRKSAGLCPTSVAPLQPGILLLNCQLHVAAEPSAGGLGGLLTSATVINPRNAVPGAPTGSLWTAYNVPEPGKEIPPPVGGDAPVVPEPSEALGLYVFRTFGEVTTRTAPSCPGSLLSPVMGARSSSLYPTATQLADGKLPEELGAPRGSLTVCFTSSGATRRSASGRISLLRNGRLLTLAASGECRDFPTPAGSHLRGQGCNLRIEPTLEQALSGIRGGLMTSNGLVRAASPVTVANSHIWTVGLFESPA